MIFGIAHGSLCVAERAGLKGPLERAPALVSFTWVTLMWVHTMAIFRAEDLRACGQIFGRMYGFLAVEGPLESMSAWWWLGVLGWFLVHWVMYKGDVLERAAKLPTWLFALLLGAGWALVLPWVGGEYTPFIYFQF